MKRKLSSISSISSVPGTPAFESPNTAPRAHPEADRSGSRLDAGEWPRGDGREPLNAQSQGERLGNARDQLFGGRGDIDWSRPGFDGGGPGALGALAASVPLAGSGACWLPAVLAPVTERLTRGAPSTTAFLDRFPPLEPK